jgi:RES domain
VIVFRNTDVDVPFFWDGAQQPAGRWHAEGEGPAQYTSSTPSAAWAEFLRHAGISDPADLAGIERTMWAIEIADDEEDASPVLSLRTLTGDRASYPACQAEAARLRRQGATRLIAPSAAVLPDAASGWVCDPDLTPAGPRDEQTIVLFGVRPDQVGWVAATLGRPEPELLDHVRHL